MFGYWGAGFVAFAALGLVFICNAVLRTISRQDSVTLLALGAIAGAAYLPPVISAQLQMPFGATFGGAVLAMFLLTYRILKRDMISSHFLDYALMALALTFFHLPVQEIPQIIPTTVPRTVTTEQRRAVIERFVSDISRPDTALRPTMFFSFGPIPDTDFAIEFYSKIGRFLTGTSMSIVADPEVAADSVHGSDYVVVFDPGEPKGTEDKWQTLTRSTAQAVVGTRGLKELDHMNFAEGTHTLYHVDRAI